MVDKKVNKDKITGYNTKNKNVFNNLNGTYIGSNNHNITFVRDYGQLLKQYSNLIHNMGRRFGNINMTYAERQDLYAYISEVFIDLVREFDMSNDMDFPGYIARMLPTRIRGSYLDSVQDYKAHITPLKDPNKSVEEIADLQYGKAPVTFSYSKNSQCKRTVRKDGKVRGVISEAVDSPITNEMDNSLAEIHSAFKLQGYNQPELHALVDYIALQGLTPREAKQRVAKDFHLTNKQVDEQYSLLVNLMKEYL